MDETTKRPFVLQKVTEKRASRDQDIEHDESHFQVKCKMQGNAEGLVFTAEEIRKMRGV